MNDTKETKTIVLYIEDACEIIALVNNVDATVFINPVVLECSGDKLKIFVNENEYSTFASKTLRLIITKENGDTHIFKKTNGRWI